MYKWKITYKKSCMYIIEKMEQKCWYKYCEHCGCNNPHSFHHIIFRSQVPNHKNLHHPDNILLVCYNCHSYFHSRDADRGKYIKRRNLHLLFPKYFNVQL